MNARGFALVAVLWVITAMTALTGAGMLVARLGSATTRNRVILTRAEWAREACGEILQARFAHDPTIRDLGRIDLGRGTWCSASLEDPAAKVNLNTADRDVLARLFQVVGLPRTLADSVITQRRQGTIYDLRQVRGVDATLAGRLAPFVTTRGIGVLNVNAAPREVLRLLPGATEESVALIQSRRTSRPLQSTDELAGTLSPASRAILLRNYSEFARTAVFAPPQLIVSLEGAVRDTPIVARATLTVVPVPGRLAVIRRETE